MSVYHELDDLSLDALKTAFNGPCPDGDEYAFSYYSDVTFLMMAKDGKDYLYSQLNISHPIRLASVVCALASHPLNDPVLNKRLVSLLAAEHELVVMTAIDGLCGQNETDVVETVLALNTHPSPYVRGAVLRYIRELFPERSFPLLIAGLQDADNVVRSVSADELGELGDIAALPYLRPLLADPHPYVQEAVQSAIEWLEDS